MRVDPRLSSPDKPNSDVTRFKIRFCLVHNADRGTLVPPMLGWAKGKSCESDKRGSAGSIAWLPQSRLVKFP